MYIPPVYYYIIPPVWGRVASVKRRFVLDASEVAVLLI